MKRFLWNVRAGFVAFALGASLFGCAKAAQDRSSPSAAAAAPSGTCACAPAGIVDPELLAFLSKARSAHHTADIREDANDKAGAVAVLEQLANGPYPGGPTPPAEVAEVTADTRARLAELRSDLGQFDAAERDVEKGLVLATQPTHFRGHLFEVLGVVNERRAKALAATGDRAGSERAKKHALEAYEKAIAIQDDVIRRALPATASPPR